MLIIFAANAVVLSVTQQAPFNPVTDPQRKLSRICFIMSRLTWWATVGVSFVSIFIVSYHLVFWVCGAAHSLSWDYLPGIPQGEDAERRYSWKEKPFGRLVARYVLRSRLVPSPNVDNRLKEENPSNLEKGEDKQSNPKSVSDKDSELLSAEPSLDVQLVRRMSRLSSASQQMQQAPLTPKSEQSSVTETEDEIPFHAPITSLIMRSLRPLSTVLTPVTIAIAIALPIALVDDLKALFVDISSTGGPDWKGPDGKPPLAFIIDTGRRTS
jgi:auxin efflux carrier family protein